jgi:signal transduction histidine kinase/pSer/pThr/pTyr-binding forkhead associated (FHA) protein
VSAKNPQVCFLPRTRLEGMEEAYALRGEQTTVGRHPSNDIVLTYDSISRFHARIDKRADYYILQDLNSSNGVYVNGERITQVAIHNGDMVTFGNLEFLFSNEETRSGASTHGEIKGKNIVDILDEKESGSQPPVTQSFVAAQDAASKAKSSVISSVNDRKIDKATLVRLNQRLSILYRLSELLRNADPDNESALLQSVLELIFHGVDADRGVILTRFHLDAEQLDVAAVKHKDEPIVPPKVTVSRTILNQVLNDRVAVLSLDAQSDDRFAHSESIIMGEIRSTICAPMIINNQVLGVLQLDSMRYDHPFDQDDLEFVSIVASETGVALQNMRMSKEIVHRSRLAAVGETVAGISHNVKNILLLSQGGAELLTRALDRGDLAGAKDSWQVVSRGIDKIGKLVRDMLAYSSNKRPEVVECDVNEMICATAEEIEEQLVQKGVALELDLDEDIKPRPLDETGLQRTIMNLIVNSMEAISHRDGRIVVSTSQKTDGTILIVVTDNGSGIPKDKLERIFFPFFTTKGSSGTGLGLPMCKKCVEDMGGTIRVESEINVGTTFTIELPVLTTRDDD